MYMIIVKTTYIFSGIWPESFYDMTVNRVAMDEIVVRQFSLTVGFYICYQLINKECIKANGEVFKRRSDF